MSQSVPMGLFAGARAPIAVETIDERTLRVRHGANAFFEAIDPDPRWTFGNFSSFLRDPAHRTALINSLIVTALSTAFAGVIGVSLAWMIARFDVAGRDGLIVLITMAAVSPPFLGAYAWRMLLGSSGILTQALGLDWTIIGLHGVIWVTAGMSSRSSSCSPTTPSPAPTRRWARRRRASAPRRCGGSSRSTCRWRCRAC